MKFLLLIYGFLPPAFCWADVQTQITCYGSQPKSASHEYFGLLIRVYYDMELKKEIGAFAQYNKKDYIPLVFDRKTEEDSENTNLGNFELHRLEVTNKQVTGDYVLTQKGAGIKQGKHLEYKNIKTGKIRTFFEIGGLEACVEVCFSNKCKFEPKLIR